MKVLTIKQPFASLIAEGIKKYEFRTWRTKYRGELLIHAGKGIDKKAMEKYKKYNLDYPSGCIIAKVVVTDCIKIDDEAKKILKEENEFVYENAIKNDKGNLYGFKIENVERITPIKVNGKLSLWDYDYKE